MTNESLRTYQDIFTEKYKKCKSKKDYKKLCKAMIKQYEVIDQVDENQWQIFSNLIGPETYLKAVAMSIKMFVLQQHGIPCDVISLSEDIDLFDNLE